MKKHFNILAIIILFLSLQSCVDTIPLPENDVDAKLRFESDISTKDGFAAKITTSAGFSDFTAIGFPKDLDVQVAWGTQDDAFQMIYSENCECYQNTLEKPVPGLLYKLEVKTIADEDVYEDITASMRLPISNNLDSIDAIRNVSIDNISSVVASLWLENGNNKSQYYHILPYRKETVIIEQGGERLEVYTGEKEYLELINHNNNNLYLEDLFHQPGFVVDYEGQDISENQLQLELLSAADIDYENEAFTKIFFEIRSVTESYFRYELYLSRKLESQLVGEVGEAIVYSNIIDGLGYFGGYSTSQDSTLLK